MRYRAPRVAGRFASWLDETKGRSGIYVFRGAWSGDVHYVGESHSGALYKTITRHFWSWSDGPRPHYTVPLIQPVELAVKLLPATRAQDEQNRLIVRLRPKHNRQGSPSDEVPF